MTIQANQSPGVSVFGATSAGGGGGGTPGGSSGQVQYNNGGSFGGMSGTTWDDTNRSLTLTGATVSTSQPVLNLSQTWNAGAVTFTGLKFNATDTASASGSLLLDLQVGSNSKFSVTKAGALFVSNVLTSSLSDTKLDLGSQRLVLDTATGIGLSRNYLLGWNVASFSAGYNTFLGIEQLVGTLYLKASNNQFKFGAADAAAPVAQTLQVQSVVAGTSNTAGTDWTLKGSAGTGTGAGGSIIFQVAPAGSSGSAQNAYSTALTITSSGAYRIVTEYDLQVKNNIRITGGNANISGNLGNITLGDNSDNYAVTISGAANTGITLKSSLSLRWTDGTSYSGTADLFLYRDAANTLALRNGTNAQLFRVYSTYNGTNDAYGAIGAAVNLDGTAGDANTLYIGSQKKGSPTALTKLAIQVDGTTRFDYNGANANTWTLTTASSTYTFDNSGGLNGLVSLRFLTTNGGTISGYINVSTSGVFLLRDGAASSFDRLQFGGTTSSFPALKRVSANLQVIAADNTASAGFIVGNQALATSATDGFLYVPTCAGTPTGTPTTQTGTAPLVVDSTNNKLYFYSGGQWRDAGP